MPHDKDTIFGRLTLERGYLTRELLDEAIKARKVAADISGVTMPLSQVLVGRGLLTPDQAQDLTNAVSVKTGEARLVAGYEVVAKIGAGGMGAVYKARKLDTGEFVALKILLPSLATPEYVRRFERESGVVKKLHHENIVGWVEFGRDERRGLHFCALEYIEGKDLGQRVKRTGALSEDEAISITYQVAKALQHAHFNGLVHRDIKPENIMVAADGTVKLLDLGLARPVGQEATRLTQSGMFVGSVFYASPEQARTSKEIDIRADIYSLGATLYYMITGRPPFEGGSVLDVLQKHVYEKLRWPAEINPEIGEGLCLVVTKMMAKDPADRYQTPIDVLRELDALKEGRRPEVGDRVMGASTIARAGVLVKRRRRPASRPGRGASRERAVERESEAAGMAPKGVSTVWALGLIGSLAAAVVIVLAVAFTRGGKEEGPKLPRVGRDTRAEPRVPSRSRRGHAAPARVKDEGGRMKTSSALSVPPSSSPRSAAAAFGEAESYERAHPDDCAGAIRRYEKVAREFPGTPEAGKARVNVIRLKAVAEAARREPAGAPPGAREFKGHWYMVYAKDRTWHDAKRLCEEKGGHLVTMTSKEEEEFVVSLAREKGGHLWIGLSDEKREGAFEWVTGEPLVFVNWVKDQPGNLGVDDEDYVFLKKAYHFAWVDVPKATTGFLICEWEPAARPPGVPEDAVAFGGHWYRLYEQRKKWHDAKRFCEEKGGHLVTITSKEENEFVTGLARKAGKVTWIGFTDEKREGKWEWVTGEPVTFTAWGTGEPDNSRGQQHFGNLWVGSGFRWADGAGDGYGSICEWELAAPARTLTLDLGGNVTMEFVYVKSGVFVMGDDAGRDDERPAHEVAITRGFYIGKYEVTQAQYERVMAANPSKFKGADRPVETVSWNDAVRFCRRLTERTGKKCRLPTEAEWEYACRAGSTTRWCFGDNEGALGDYAWYNGNSGMQTHTVGKKKRNAWGLHDIHGNVREGCADWYDEAYYLRSPREDPTGPRSGSSRTNRGGSWSNNPNNCRSAYRLGREPSGRSHTCGFRAAVSASPRGK